MNWLVLHFKNQFRTMRSYSDNHLPRYQWYTSSGEIQKLINPFLTIKKTTSDALCKYVDQRSDRSARQFFWKAASEANNFFFPLQKIVSTQHIIPTKTDYAYLAGIVDTEGSFGLVKRTGTDNRYYWNFAVWNSDQRIFDWISRRFPGWLNISRNRKFKGKPCRDMGGWIFPSADKCENLLLSVLPYLIIKRERAKIMLEWIRKNKEYSDATKAGIFDTMTRFNLRGVSPETIRQAQQDDVVMTWPDPISDCRCDSTGM